MGANISDRDRDLQNKQYKIETILSKPNATQLNSKQLKNNFVGLDIVVTWNAYISRGTSHISRGTSTPNFSGTSRPARELKFGTDTH